MNKDEITKLIRKEISKAMVDIDIKIKDIILDLLSEVKKNEEMDKKREEYYKQLPDCTSERREIFDKIKNTLEANLDLILDAFKLSMPNEYRKLTNILTVATLDTDAKFMAVFEFLRDTIHSADSEVCAYDNLQEIKASFEKELNALSDIFIDLKGTNDFVYRFEAEEFLNNLEKGYSAALPKKGASYFYKMIDELRGNLYGNLDYMTYSLHRIEDMLLSENHTNATEFHYSKDEHVVKMKYTLNLFYSMKYRIHLLNVLNNQ